MLRHETGDRHVARLKRREVLQIGYSGLTGIGCASLLALRARAAVPRVPEKPVHRVRTVLLVYMTGAPSHIDTFDPKPDAPAEVRGAFKTTATRIAGVHFCEHLPQTAARAHHLAVVRTMTQGEIDHERGSHTMLTGIDRLPLGANNLASRRDWPCFSGALDYLKPRHDGIPNGLLLPVRLHGRGDYSGQHAGLLGAKHDPWLVNLDPNNPMSGVQEGLLPLGLRVEPNRLADRRALLSQIDAQRKALIDSAECRQFSVSQQTALSMLTSGRLTSAFALDREPATVRERYGRHLFGQSLLLARRVVELGVPVVQVNLGTTNCWDTHRDNCRTLQNSLLPPFDRAFSALLDDLAERGLLAETLVVATGEFGRTPKLGGNIGSPAFDASGRDHWTPVFTSVFAGGGVRGGQVIGRSDRIGAYPKTRSFYPSDLGATVFSSLGVATDAELRDQQGRPLQLNRGSVIEPLYSGVEA